MAKKKTKVKRIKREVETASADKQYAKAVALYLTGDTDKALEAIKATLAITSNHCKAKELRKRLTEGDRANVTYSSKGVAVYKDGNGHFLPGQSANPTGRPSGTPNKISIKMLMTKLEEVEGGVDEKGRKREELLVHFIKRAYKSDTVLLGLFKKMLPDLKVIEGLIATSALGMPEEESSEIQAILRQRYLAANEAEKETDVDTEKN